MPDNPLPEGVMAELLYGSGDAVLVSDPSGRIRFASRAAETLFAYDEGELAGLTIESLMPEQRRRQHVQLRKRYGSAPRSRPSVSGLRILAQRKDGEQFSADISLQPLRAGGDGYVASIVTEVAADNPPDAYFRTLLDSAPDAMVIVDEKAVIAVVNTQAEKMFACERSDLLGRRIEDLMPERMREAHIRVRDRYIAQPALRPMGDTRELVARRSNGEEFPVEISLSPVATSRGMFIASVIRDITERKRMERKIFAAQKETERANKANNAFLAAASHDLRQPVQALSLLNGALRRTVQNPRALEMVEHQEHSLTAMTNLLNSLLDISRLDAGAVSPEFERFPIQRLIDRLSAEFGRQAQHKGLQFEAVNCASVIRSDPNLLAEIIQNFMSNAIRYTAAGKVTMSCRVEGEQCWLDVSDSGMGIEADQLEAIFQEFHQVKAQSGGKEGFGLGLAIVRRLADLLGHRIDVQSTPGSGSIFSVCLPVVEENRVNPAVAKTEQAVEDSCSGIILLIEDDINVANAWGMLLEAEGYQVATASSAREARAIIGHLDELPALIISDFHLLDGSTGVEAIAGIRDYYELEIPAFVVSGDTSKVVKDARPLSNCTTMNKPIDTTRLLAAAAIATSTGFVPED